jgi:predicted ATPase/class 3 adenylate cyclase
MVDQPSGTVTLVFTDVEGSTRMLEEVGHERYRRALADHHSAMREVFGRLRGYEVDSAGDSLFYAFSTAAAAVSAVSEAMANLSEGPIRVRVGIHTGEPVLDPPKYVGMDVHRAARVMAAAHGGQAVISQTTRDLLDSEGGLRDLGEHRLKDLSAPLRLYQLGQGEFPPLRSLYRTNLPVPATAFLGREQELAEVVDVLGREGVRLVTLTGPGGTGKTRLALQAAAEAAEDYPDGIWWLPLAPLRDPGLVPLSIAETLQLRDEPGMSTRERLAAGLTGKRLLLLLDNAEHLLPRLAESIAELHAIGGPLLVVTSRERLQVQGEHVYPVPAMTEGDGVDLFVMRARQLDPGFEISADVGTLCERLDRLPLALELAAARTNLYSPAQLLERLADRLDLLEAGRDSDPRQRTLRATIDWSYELLTPEEQRVYRALSVFAGGCTIEAAQEVCGADPNGVASLLDKSLLRRREAPSGRRYWMLETIREHAAEQLDRLGERGSADAAHADYFLHVAEESYRRMTTLGGDDALAYHRIIDDRDNLRASLSYHRDRGATRELSRLCAALWFAWYFRGDAREGRQWLQAAIDLGPPDDLRPDLENALAALLYVTGDEDERALPMANAAVDHARDRGDRPAEVMGLITVGNLLAELDWTASHEAHLAARRLAAEIGDPWRHLTATIALVQMAISRGDLDEAAAELATCRALVERHGGASLHPVSTLSAQVEWSRGDVEAAREHLGQGLAEMRRNPMWAAYYELMLAAELAAHDGELEQAALLFSAACAFWSELGLGKDEFDSEREARLETRVRELLGEEQWEAATARGLLLTLDDALELALRNADRS